MITVETVKEQGAQYENFISIAVGFSMSAIARDFQIVVARPNNKPLPFKGGDQIRIRADGDLICDGFIDIITPDYSKSDHAVSMQGRSKIQDLVDSSLLPISFGSDISLVNVIENVIKQIGLDTKVINNVPDLEDFKIEEDKINAGAGVNAFDFIDGLARKRQVLLTSDAEGNVVITRTGTIKNTIPLTNVIGGQGNIKSGSVEHDTTNRFNKYILISQTNTTTGAFSFTPAGVVSPQSESIDSNIRPRQQVIIAEKASSNDQLQKRADWQNNIARANSRVYSAAVDGVRARGGELWDINKLQDVNDEFADINETMLIDSVRFTSSKSDGTNTSLSFVDKNAYDQKLAEPIPIQQAKSGIFNTP